MYEINARSADLFTLEICTPAYFQGSLLFLYAVLNLNCYLTATKSGSFMLYKIRLLYLSGKSRNEKLVTTAISAMIMSLLF